MNLFFRLFIVVIHSIFRKRLHPLSESVLHLRVLPNDLDLNLHMNNGRFLAIMDLGRMDLMLRTGMLKTVLKQRWSPLVGEVQIKYKYSLKPFRRYRLRTRVIEWDNKWVTLEQRFEIRNRAVAIAQVKTLFRGPKGNISPEDMMKGRL